jgi:hypothetical protein
MKDYPVEQFLRDEKVHSIFEGTNGIQALDLLTRKVVKGLPSLCKGLFNDIENFCEINSQHKYLAKNIALLSNGLSSLKEVTAFLTEKAKQDFKIMALFATQ